MLEQSSFSMIKFLIRVLIYNFPAYTIRQTINRQLLAGSLSILNIF